LKPDWWGSRLVQEEGKTHVIRGDKNNTNTNNNNVERQKKMGRK
jgi:hypothetical protein